MHIYCAVSDNIYIHENTALKLVLRVALRVYFDKTPKCHNERNEKVNKLVMSTSSVRRHTTVSPSVFDFGT